MHTACTPHSNWLSDCNSTAASRSGDVLFCSHFNVPSCSRCLHSRVNTISIYTLRGSRGLFLTVFITLHCQFKWKKNKPLHNSQSDFRLILIIISRTFSLCNLKYLLKALLQSYPCCKSSKPDELNLLPLLSLAINTDVTNIQCLAPENSLIITLHLAL